MVGPQVKRQAVNALREACGLGVTRACGLVGIARSLYGYRSRRPKGTRRRARISELAGAQRRAGYRRLHVLLRQAGWPVNQKRTYRRYREAGLAVQGRKRTGLFERTPLPKPAAVHRSWSMDCVADGLCAGRRLRCLAIVDDFSRPCLVLEVDPSSSGRRVVAALKRLAELRGLPQSISVDHGPECERRILDAWTYRVGVRLHFIRPGKPIENAYIERFHGRFQDARLNAHWCLTLAHARRVLERWQIQYHTA